jgi:hypothetical protein
MLYSVADFLLASFTEWHLVAESFHVDAALCEGLIDGLVFPALADSVVVGSVDEHGELVRNTPEKVNRGASYHVLFQVEDEGFLGGHVGAEVATLEFLEDEEFGIALGSMLKPTPHQIFRLASRTPSTRIEDEMFLLLNSRSPKFHKTAQYSASVKCFFKNTERTCLSCLLLGSLQASFINRRTAVRPKQIYVLPR